MFSSLISSDWNECLCQSTPFDPISFVYPGLGDKLQGIFRRYTGNIISLSQAAREVRGMLPAPLGPDEMDAYLDQAFRPYRGVIELINWCMDNGILFLINTTAFQAYFQRAKAKGLLPEGVLVAANPSIKYPSSRPPMYDINEIEDKASVTRTVMDLYGIRASRVIVMGDSGGDGPHFAWGASVGAFLVGSMTKPSLDGFCKARGIEINMRIGIDYSQGLPRDAAAEMEFDFMSLRHFLTDFSRA
jgi:hypothetical protein